MASLRERRRKDGTYTYAVLFTIDGRQTSVPWQTKREAEAFRDMVNAVGPNRAMEMYSVPDTKRAIRKADGWTVREWLEHHIKHLTGVEQKTIDDYERYLRRDIGPTLGDIPITHLSEDDISSWVQDLADAGAAPKTIKNKHGFLSGALAAAVPKHIPANPAAGRRLPRGDGDDHEPRYLSREEFGRLLNEVTAAWKPLMEFMVNSGLRWGEVCALKPSDVVRSTGVVRIRRAWKLSSKGYHVGPPKTKRSKRDVVVKADVLAKLAYSGDWLFTNPGRGRRNAGGPVRYSNFRRNVWDPAVKRAGLDPKPTPHDLRHTHASWLLNDNVPITVVSRRLGHESIQVTVDIYGHIADAADQDAANSIGGY